MYAVAYFSLKAQPIWYFSKFIYSEKATNFCEIFPLLLTIKSKGKILQNFVAFSECMNFNYVELIIKLDSDSSFPIGLQFYNAFNIVQTPVNLIYQANWDDPRSWKCIKNRTDPWSDLMWEKIVLVIAKNF